MRAVQAAPPGQPATPPGQSMPAFGHPVPGPSGPPAPSPQQASRPGSHPGGPRRPRPAGTRLALQAAGLLAVALVAGLVWGLIRSSGGGAVGGDPSPTADPLTSGKFDYSVVAGPERATDCAANSYGRVVDWFGAHPCTRLARGLYTTTVDGARALVSVSLVTMPDAKAANQLKIVTDTDNTGNVADLLKDGTVSLPDAPNIASGHYASMAKGNEVTIVEANFFGGHVDDPLLARVGEDALRLAKVLR